MLVLYAMLHELYAIKKQHLDIQFKQSKSQCNVMPLNISTNCMLYVLELKNCAWHCVASEPSYPFCIQGNSLT